MTVIPCRFYCTICHMKRFAGDCSHSPRVIEPPDNALNALRSDTCDLCCRNLRACECSIVTSKARKAMEEIRLLQRVRALVDCPCKHHRDAYVTGDVKNTIACCPACPVMTQTAPELRDLSHAPGTGAVIRLPYQIVRDVVTLNDSNPLAKDPEFPDWVFSRHCMLRFGEVVAKDCVEAPENEKRRKFMKVILNPASHLPARFHGRGLALGVQDGCDCLVYSAPMRYPKVHGLHDTLMVHVGQVLNSILDHTTTVMFAREVDRPASEYPILGFIKDVLVAVVMPRRCP